MAGYDPNSAIKFWERMSKVSSGQQPPEWLSTHPLNETRIAEMKKNLPEAIKYYQKVRIH
ncbi:MAG: M48 family metalloprotease, partial [Bacteroidales bacterium]